MSHVRSVLLCLLSLPSVLSASPITYQVVIDTSSVSGTSGSLDLNFNPGPLMTQAASLQVYSFTSGGGSLGPGSIIGDTSGDLSTTLTFDNGTGFNDYFAGFTYGNSITFTVSLYGPALTFPDGISTSGSTFAFSLFSDAAGTIPALTNDTTDGFAFLTNVNLDGTTTITNYSPETTVSAGPLAPSPVSPVPEPSSIILLTTSLIVLAGIMLRNKREMAGCHPLPLCRD